jgi:hypothetical protein
MRLRPFDVKFHQSVPKMPHINKASMTMDESFETSRPMITAYRGSIPYGVFGRYATVVPPCPHTLFFFQELFTQTFISA